MKLGQFMAGFCRSQSEKFCCSVPPQYARLGSIKDNEVKFGLFLHVSQPLTTLIGLVNCCMNGESFIFSERDKEGGRLATAEVRFKRIRASENHQVVIVQLQGPDKSVPASWLHE